MERREEGRLNIEGYLTTHSLFSSDVNYGWGEKKKKESRKPSHDLDTKSESEFYLVFFQRPPLAVWIFKWVLDEYPDLA